MFNKGQKTSSIQSSDNNNNAPSFSSLPSEMISLIGSFLDKQSLGRASRIDRRQHAFLKAPLTQIKAEELLKEAMYANPKGVEKLLNMPHSDSECIVLKRVGGVEECARPWERVSGLEYTAWAGDTEIVQILLKAVPKSEHNKAIEQLQGVMQKGMEHGNHLAPYYSLIEAYDEYIAKFDGWSWEERNDYWVHKIGKEQFMLPLVGLQQMCDKEPFDPVPSFKQAPDRSFKLYNGSSLVPLSISGLADRFALHKGLRQRGAGLGVLSASRPTVDVAAFRRLCEVRTKELISIIEQLQKPSVEMESHEDTDRLS